MLQHFDPGGQKWLLTSIYYPIVFISQRMERNICQCFKNVGHLECANSEH